MNLSFNSCLPQTPLHIVLSLTAIRCSQQIPTYSATWNFCVGLRNQHVDETEESRKTNEHLSLITINWRYLQITTCNFWRTFSELSLKKVVASCNFVSETQTVEIVVKLLKATTASSKVELYTESARGNTSAERPKPLPKKATAGKEESCVSE